AANIPRFGKNIKEPQLLRFILLRRKRRVKKDAIQRKRQTFFMGKQPIKRHFRGTESNRAISREWGRTPGRNRTLVTIAASAS
ncbi:MAG: hypothetical protein DSY57_04070, partial [Desulfobulbus sp.]